MGNLSSVLIGAQSLPVGLSTDRFVVRFHHTAVKVLLQGRSRPRQRADKPSILECGEAAMGPQWPRLDAAAPASELNEFDEEHASRSPRARWIAGPHMRVSTLRWLRWRACISLCLHPALCQRRVFSVASLVLNDRRRRLDENRVDG
jgi:hypothetical protein